MDNAVKRLVNYVEWWLNSVSGSDLLQILKTIKYFDVLIMSTQHEGNKVDPVYVALQTQKGSLRVSILHRNMFFTYHFIRIVV